MSNKPEQRDLRELQRTDESRAAEKKVGDFPFDERGKRPQDASTEPPHAMVKQ